MKLASLLNGRPGLITPEGFSAFVQTCHGPVAKDYADRRAWLKKGPLAARPKNDLFGNPLPKMSMADGTAVIPIHGPVGIGLDPWDKVFGATDLGDVTDDIATSVAGGAKRIIFHINSPGGMVQGTPELAAKIAGLPSQGIKTYAIADQTIASAAYWLACSTQQIYVTGSSDIGSIGVYLAMFDLTGLYSAAGIKVELIKAGKLKGAGFPGTSLSDESRAHLQSEVDSIYEAFTGFVKTHRPKVQPETMQGQSFMGSKALALGLVDRILPGLPEALAAIIGSKPAARATTPAARIAPTAQVTAAPALVKPAPRPGAKFETLLAAQRSAGKSRAEAWRTCISTYPQLYAEWRLAQGIDAKQQITKL
jgi:signal peptide peptidase SppA